MSNQHVGDDSFYIKHIATLCVFSCLAISAVVLRFWSRRIQRLALEWSDFLILPGLVCKAGHAPSYGVTDTARSARWERLALQFTVHRFDFACCRHDVDQTPVCFFGRRRDESSDQSPQAQETAVILASKVRAAMTYRQ